VARRSRQQARARHHAVPHRPGRRDGGSIGSCRRRPPLGAGIGPAYADRPGASESAWRPARRPGAARQAGPILPRRMRPSSASTVSTVSTSTSWSHRPLSGAGVWSPTLPTPHSWCRSASLAASTSCSKARQGTLLDLDHGSYPFVTRPTPSPVGVHRRRHRAAPGRRGAGVMKAYATRVGAGPFPTELGDTIGEGIIDAAASTGPRPGDAAGSAGSTPCRCAMPWRSTASPRSCSTRSHPFRPRRCLICMAYEVDGRGSTGGRRTADVLARAKPIYERFPGWAEPLHDAEPWAICPRTAQALCRCGRAPVWRPICFVSVGPERHQTIERMPRPQRRSRYLLRCRRARVGRSSAAQRPTVSPQASSG